MRLKEGCKPDSFEPHNSPKLSFTNILHLCPNFVECESFLVSNFWHSCPLWDKLGWLNWFWQFLCEGLSSFNPKDSIIHVHGLAVYVKGGHPFAQNLSLENSADCYLCFRLALLHSVLLLFPLLITFFYHYGTDRPSELWYLKLSYSDH